jgi:hypothetical protein
MAVVVAYRSSIMPATGGGNCRTRFRREASRMRIIALEGAISDRHRLAEVSVVELQFHDYHGLSPPHRASLRGGGWN